LRSEKCRRIEKVNPFNPRKEYNNADLISVKGSHPMEKEQLTDIKPHVLE
jgi:hypothetical protein